MVGLLLAWAVGVAHATSAGTLPGGAQLAYAGAALDTYGRRWWWADGGAAVQEVDRVMDLRLDTAYLAGLSSRLTVQVAVPFLRSTVRDDPDRAPCGQAQAADLCHPVTTVGYAALQVRYRLLSSPLTISPLLVLGGDPWDRDLRGRYTATGEGTVDLVPGLAVGRDLVVGATTLDLHGWGAYGWRFGSLVEDGPAGSFRAPADDLRGGIALGVRPPGRLGFEVGLDGYHRLWGLDWDAGYQQHYFSTEDRWDVLWEGQVAARLEVSVALPRQSGVQASLNRVLASRNGPTDTTGVSIGLFRSFGPRKAAPEPPPAAIRTR